MQPPELPPHSLPPEEPEPHTDNLLKEAFRHVSKIKSGIAERKIPVTYFNETKHGEYPLGIGTSGQGISAYAKTVQTFPLGNPGEYELSIRETDPEEGETDYQTLFTLKDFEADDLKIADIPQFGVQIVRVGDTIPTIMKKAELLTELHALKEQIGDLWPQNIDLPPQIENVSLDQTEEDAELFRTVVSALANQEASTHIIIHKENDIHHTLTANTGINNKPVSINYQRNDRSQIMLAGESREIWEFAVNDQDSHYIHFGPPQLTKGYINGDVPHEEMLPEEEEAIEDLEHTAKHLLGNAAKGSLAMQYPDMYKGIVYLEQLATAA